MGTGGREEGGHTALAHYSWSLAKRDVCLPPLSPHQPSPSGIQKCPGQGRSAAATGEDGISSPVLGNPPQPGPTAQGRGWTGASGTIFTRIAITSWLACPTSPPLTVSLGGSEEMDRRSKLGSKALVLCDPRVTWEATQGLVGSPVGGWGRAPGLIYRMSWDSSGCASQTSHSLPHISQRSDAGPRFHSGV